MEFYITKERLLNYLEIFLNDKGDNDPTVYVIAREGFGSVKFYWENHPCSIAVHDSCRVDKSGDTEIQLSRDVMDNIKSLPDGLLKVSCANKVTGTNNEVTIAHWGDCSVAITLP